MHIECIYILLHISLQATNELDFNRSRLLNIPPAVMHHPHADATLFEDAPQSSTFLQVDWGRIKRERGVWPSAWASCWEAASASPRWPSAPSPWRPSCCGCCWPPAGSGCGTFWALRRQSPSRWSRSCSPSPLSSVQRGQGRPGTEQNCSCLLHQPRVGGSDKDQKNKTYSRKNENKTVIWGRKQRVLQMITSLSWSLIRWSQA